MQVEGKYYLVPKTDYYSLIPETTLNFLLHYVKGGEKIIKLFIVLFDYFNLEKTFSMIDLHYELGYNLSKDGKPISKNSIQIRTMMMILSEAGLVKYTIKEGRNQKGAPIDLYYITCIRSNVSDEYCKSYERLKKSGEIIEDGVTILEY